MLMNSQGFAGSKRGEKPCRWENSLNFYGKERRHESARSFPGHKRKNEMEKDRDRTEEEPREKMGQGGEGTLYDDSIKS